MAGSPQGEMVDRLVPRLVVGTPEEPENQDEGVEMPEGRGKEYLIAILADAPATKYPPELGVHGSDYAARLPNRNRPER